MEHLVHERLAGVVVHLFSDLNRQLYISIDEIMSKYEPTFSPTGPTSHPPKMSRSPAAQLPGRGTALCPERGEGAATVRSSCIMRSRIKHRRVKLRGLRMLEALLRHHVPAT